MNCTLCGNKIELQPSATERAKKYGGKPADYTRLFTVHAACQIKANQQSASALMRRISEAK